MPPIDLKSAFILLTALAAFFSQHVTSQLPTDKPTFVSVDCNIDNSGIYTANSTYRRNLDLILSDLASHAATTAFYNSSVGPTDGPDMAYGQYYCRGDVSTQLCGDCVKAAAEVANGTDCFGVRDGNIWFQECTLHYDNKSRVGLWDYTLAPDWTLSDVNVSDPTQFEQALGSLVDTLIKKAAYGGDPWEFATGEANLTKYATRRFIVCYSATLITGQLCESCLRAGLRFLVDNYFGHDPEEVLLFYPNWQVRYGLAPFFRVSSGAKSDGKPFWPDTISPS